MAKREVVECDKCSRPGRTFVLWAEGDAAARSVDLCESHSRPVSTPFAEGSVVDLPSKPRARMEVTRLKTTARTRSLKKEVASGQEDKSQRPDEEDQAQA